MFLILLYLGFAFYKREIAVCVLPLFFPLYLLRFSFFGIPFTVLEGLCYAVFLPVFFDICKDAFRGHFKYTAVYFLLDLLFLACVIGAFIVPKETLMIDGVTTYEGRRVALGILKGFVFAPILYFISFMRVCKTEELRKFALKSYFASAFLLSLWGIWQALTGDYITPDFRASGPFESANYLALYIGPASAAAFVYLWKRISSEKSILEYVLLFCVLFSGLLASHSYGALIAVFVAMFFFVFFSARKFWRFFLVCILSLFFVGIFAVQAGSEKFSGFLELKNRSSSSVRLEVWEIALNLVKENPVFGIGLGQFEPQYQLNAVSILGHAPYEWVMLHPHNLYLAFFLNSGILGLFAFFGFIFLGIRNFARADPEKKAFYIFGVVMIITILVHGFFDVPFWKNDLAPIFWLSLGMLL